MIVKHQNGQYPIELLSVQEIVARLPANARVLTDQNVRAAWPSVFEQLSRVLVLPAGEPTKSMSHYEDAMHWLAQSRARRGDPIVALGGGVIGDLAGFVAATYLRGVPLIQVPTTLLAMVDSSVGGKVGIDLPHGKNLVGAFKAPTHVYVASEFLKTLPEREFRNGTAEVLKYGFISDPALARELLQRLEPTSQNLNSIIERCIAIKSQIVEADEFETNGIRATLNFGHTIGHAIEKVAGYREILHGEAIAIGMAVEAKVGHYAGITDSKVVDFICEAIAEYGLPDRIPAAMSNEELLVATQADKKNVDDEISMCLLTDLGTCKLVHKVDKEWVTRALNDFR